MVRKKINNYFLHFFESVIFLFIFLNLLNSVRSKPVELDEIAWLHDTNIYKERIDNNWSYFNYNKLVLQKSWRSHDFRLFDQPHLVKYIYGFAFMQTGIDNWSDKAQEYKNYSYFLSDGKNLNTDINSKEFSDQAGSSVAQAIVVARTISLTFFLSSLIILFYFLKKEFGNLSASLSLIFIYSNQTIINGSSLATADNIFQFFVILSLICFYYLFWENISLNNKSRFFLIFSSALLTSFAVGSKINGLILVYLFIIFKIIDLIFSKKIKILKSLYELTFWLLLIFINYLYLQPELGSGYISGFYRFISQRFEQQSRFYNVFGSLDILNYAILIIKKYLGDNFNILYLIKLMVLIIGLPYYFYKKSMKSTSNREKSLDFSSIFISSILIFTYASVGFDRYLVIPIIILIIVSVRGLTLIIFDKKTSLASLKKQQSIKNVG
ncbi:MAG: hypothetical protein GW942_00790 [Candidatus Pacebacteria bacterium]|nr:hypothetical protein [Candidatus Paceibacterota bacterium]